MSWIIYFNELILIYFAYYWLIIIIKENINTVFKNLELLSILAKS